MIAFDIDGVFSPDFDLHNGFTVPEMLTVRKHIKPLFQIPMKIGVWYAITGRPYSDDVETYEWFQDNMPNPPTEIFCNPYDMKFSALHKAVTLIMIQAKVFIESDPEQAVIIKNMCQDCKVYTFQEMIAIGLNNIWNPI